ncbi:MAG TPA: SAM-dependent methyltransferase [Geminicoccaceae bacterium]
MPHHRASSDPEDGLLRTIAAEGPVSVARYMELCLDHPEHGYYRRAEPFGVAGDFVTGPEVSQMFGEIVGLFLAQAWLDQGRPDPVRLVELGPGRATQLRDLLRATAAVPGFQDALDLHLVERSPRLVQVQQAALGEHAATWHARLEDVPEGPLLLVANEFLDALPVHQLVRRDDVWIERRIAVAGGRLGFEETVPAAPGLAGFAPPDAPEGAVSEVSPARQGLVREVAGRLVRDGGLALLIDYGAARDGPTGDTLQAVRAHRPVDPLEQPGTADLSSQVDFRALAQAAGAEGATSYGPVFQGTFLRTLGIEVRAARLIEAAEGDDRRSVRRALHRLADPGAMGEVFKVLVLTAPDAPPPPGFVEDE